MVIYWFMVIVNVYGSNHHYGRNGDNNSDGIVMAVMKRMQGATILE